MPDPELPPTLLGDVPFRSFHLAGRAPLAANTPPKARGGRFLIGLLVALSAGCSVAAEGEEIDQDSGSTHAVVKVRHTLMQDGSARGDALTGFVRVPLGSDPQMIFQLAGLVQSLPPIGECRTDLASSDALDLSEVSSAELLEARSVDLLTPTGRHELAPFAFPTVADLLRGVVYTSRDRDASTLPPGANYSLDARGIVMSPDMEELNLTSELFGPDLPSNVRVGAVALADVSILPSTGVLDLSWLATSTSEDLILATLRTQNVSWNCTFADKEGFGSLPLVTDNGESLAEQGGTVQLELHRIRSKSRSGSGGIAEVRVTFDFAVQAQLEFIQAEQ